jgi:predicted DNA-binding protein with PD1-like motif
MQVIARDAGRHVLSLARGEELFEALLTFASREGFAGATLTGLGAADRLELAYYDLRGKAYVRQPMDEEVEILSLIGNFARLDGEPALHIHGVFGRRNFSTFGGHLFSLRVSGACEIHLDALAAPIGRAHDEATGLNLLCPLPK